MLLDVGWPGATTLDWHSVSLVRLTRCDGAGVVFRCDIYAV